MKRRLFGHGSDKSGAVAATVGLSLFALVAVGGIAFDYARLAALDTELQNAADQAALAAATQLDQQTNAVARATAAAQALLANQTLQANDNNAAGLSVNMATVVFYSTKAAAEADNGTNCPTAGAVTADATARFVCVRTMNRVARYALTPVVAAFSSGNISAMAVAGLGQSICKTPPVMICNPKELTGDPNFTVSDYLGKGLKLVSVGQGGGAWAPGNFGYLDTHGGSNGAPGLREALGWVTPPGDCLTFDGVDTKPGASVSVTDAINTRFDIYDSNSSCESGGSCPASINSIKDVVRNADVVSSDNNACKLHGSGWHEAPSTDVYMPDANDALTPIVTAITPAAMGHPRDMCHAASSSALNYCAGTVGTGAWDRNAYFRANYGWTSAQWPGYLDSGVASARIPTTNTTPTRYQVYQWEIANRDTVIGGKTILGPNPQNAPGSDPVKYGKPVCSSEEGFGSGTVPGGASPDRRRLSVAVVNCSNADDGGPVNGNSDGVSVLKWIEVFLVEPSFSRGAASISSGGTVTNARSPTHTGDVYVEVIGETTAGTGSSAGQVVRRDVPYIIK